MRGGPRDVGRIRVLYRDAGWLALDKPAGLVTTAAGAGARCLVERAKAIAPEATHHHPLSRLDADVTGVVLFALSRRAIEEAERARAAGTYRRAYVGLLPRAPAGDGAWTWPVAVDPRDATRRVIDPEGSGVDSQAARTEYATRAVALGGVALVGFRPVTGRTHQILVHAAAAGVPILGDGMYVGARRVVLDDGGVVSAPRVLLHAWHVEIPGRGERVVAPLAADMLAAWAACGGAPAACEPG